jgi:hypothetical protein
MRSVALIIASLATAFVQAAAAQEVPGRVGRLAYTQGPVSVYQDPELGWDKAYVNTPVTSENSVWTDRGARAEMRVGGTAIRLDGETQLDVSRLDEDVLDATVQRGTVNVRVRYKERNDHVTFATPHALFNIETDGRYRIDVDEDRDESRLTVFGGYGYLEGSSGRVPVEPGRTVIVSGAGQYDFVRATETSFDGWAATRDQQWQDSNSRRYVSNDMTGYEELDRYGTWAQDADYGAVWYPTRVAAGWAPYRDGHWTYVRPWGYTWVDDAPWGYAPSHYGRWVQVRDRWGWMPGSVRERPVWAPALVGFIGGSGFSVGISSGSPVGWYPLAPWERYDPWYRASPAYVTSVNRYVVDRAPRGWQGRGDDWRRLNRDRATTVVNRDVFVNRRRVQDAIVRMSPEVIRQSSVVSSAQVAQQVLPQRNELVRYREQNRVSVAAPLVVRERERRVDQRSPQVAVQQQQPQQQAGQVVRPDFRRRAGAPMATNPAAAVVVQPPVSAPAPQAQQPQQQNPAVRVDRAQQRQAEEAARATAQQQQRAAETQRQQNEQAQRQQQEQSQRAARDAQQQQERAARDNQQQQQRQSREAQQAQERAQREAQQQQQSQAQDRAAQERAARESAQQQQQAAELQRKREEAAQRAARDTQARDQAYRQQQEAAQQRAQQQQQQRAQQQQQQAQERAQRQQPQPAQPQPAPAQPQQAQQQQAQPQQAQPQQAQPQPQQQANPAARGDNRGRAKDDKDEKDKDKDKKDKDKR